MDARLRIAAMGHGWKRRGRRNVVGAWVAVVTEALLGRWLNRKRNVE